MNATIPGTPRRGLASRGKRRSRRKRNVGMVWRALAARRGGQWVFLWLVCCQAPCCRTIRFRFVELGSGCCKVWMRKCHAVLNHIASLHAIAMCSMAELASGTMMEVTVPPTHRWIPKGMTVQ